MARKTFQAANVELRHKTYFAVLYVPSDVRHILGKTKFTRSTQTGDRRLAEQRASAFVISWKSEISRARHESPDPIISEALDLFEHLKRKDLLPGFVEEIIENRTHEIGRNIHPLAGENFELIATGVAADRKLTS